jgi:S-adenosyl methyltransferase
MAEAEGIAGLDTSVAHPARVYDYWLGTGIPAAGNTHEVAQRAAPDGRVVYVDNDPIVLLHAQALLRSTPEGATAYLQADLRDPGAILDRAASLLDSASRWRSC